jgi:hypothetical protein
MKGGADELPNTCHSAIHILPAALVSARCQPAYDSVIPGRTGNVTPVCRYAVRAFVDQLIIENLTGPLVLDFWLIWRPVGVTLHARETHDWPQSKPFRYVAGREPALAALCSPVLVIPAKKALRPFWAT